MVAHIQRPPHPKEPHDTLTPAAVTRIKMSVVLASTTT